MNRRDKHSTVRMDDFHSNLSEAIGDLRAESAFFDVTLGTPGANGRKLQGHKVILSAFSEFFKEVLLEDEHPKPYIYLKGMSYRNMQSILDFIYQGEVSIASDELENFWSITEELKIKGLSGKNGSNIVKEEEEIVFETEDEEEDPMFIAPKSETKVLRSSARNALNRKTDDSVSAIEFKLEQVFSEEDLDTIDVLATPQKPKRGRKKKIKKKNKDLSAKLKGLVERFDDKSGRCKCIECDKTFSSYVGIRQHLDVVHNEKADSFQCTMCEKIVKSKQKFRIHLNYGHEIKGKNILEQYGTVIG